jgi:anti-sigma B factor antagonist
MGIERRVEGTIQVIACEGELALGSGDDALLAVCDEALSAGATWIVLDLTGVTYLDSAGVGAIVECSKHAADRGAGFRLVAVSSGSVRRVLAVTHLDRAFDVFGTVQRAMESLPR